MEKKVLILFLNKLREEFILTLKLTGCPSLKLIHNQGNKLLTGPGIYSREVLKLEAEIAELKQSRKSNPIIEKPSHNLFFSKL